MHKERLGLEAAKFERGTGNRYVNLVQDMFEYLSSKYKYLPLFVPLNLSKLWGFQRATTMCMAVMGEGGASSRQVIHSSTLTLKGWAAC